MNIARFFNPLFFIWCHSVRNYIFVDDLLNCVGLARYYFMRRHPDVRVIAVPQKDWRKLAQEAKKDQLDPATGLETCKWRSYVELVEYDDDIKKILGVTTESLAIAENGTDVVYHVLGSETTTKGNKHNFLDNADIKSELITPDYGDYVYDEEDIDMRYYYDDYEEDVIDVENDSPCTPEKQMKLEAKTELDRGAYKSAERISGCPSSVKKKGKRTQLKVCNGSSIGSSGVEDKKRGTNEEAPLSPSFHRPWQLPHPMTSQSSSVYPNARSPRLSSPVQPTPLSAPPQHGLSQYSMSPQPYLLPTSQRPEQSLSASPFPFHQISSPPAIPLYPNFSSATRDYPPSPVREFSRTHSFQGLPPPGYHGYHHPSSPGHAPGRMISLVPPRNINGNTTGPSLATITHEQQILPNVSVVTLEHLQAYQHLRGAPGIHQVQGYPHPYHPR